MGTRNMLICAANFSEIREVTDWVESVAEFEWFCVVLIMVCSAESGSSIRPSWPTQLSGPHLLHLPVHIFLCMPGAQAAPALRGFRVRGCVRGVGSGFPALSAGRLPARLAIEERSLVYAYRLEDLTVN